MKQIQKNKNKMGSYNSTPTLNQYGDLTKQAKEGKARSCNRKKRRNSKGNTKILSRRTKNNPCLIGEPGVGKNCSCRGTS